jgi:hypothetical protein
MIVEDSFSALGECLAIIEWWQGANIMDKRRGDDDRGGSTKPPTYLGLVKTAPKAAPDPAEAEVEAILSAVETVNEGVLMQRLRGIGVPWNAAGAMVHEAAEKRRSPEYRRAYAMVPGPPVYQQGGANPCGAWGSDRQPQAPDNGGAGFPWRGGDPVGIEPPLGYDVKAVPPNCGGAGGTIAVGENNESAAPLQSAEVSAPVSVGQESDANGEQ